MPALVLVLALALELAEEDVVEPVPALIAVRSGFLAVERRTDSASFIIDSCILQRNRGITQRRWRNKEQEARCAGRGGGAWRKNVVEEERNVRKDGGGGRYYFQDFRFY